jgi:hypothetical protein
MVAIIFWGIWLVDEETNIGSDGGVSKGFALTVGTNVGVLVILDAARFAMDNDPVPVLISLLLAIRILEEYPLLKNTGSNVH